MPFKLSHSRKYLVTIPTEENSKEVGGLLPQKVFKTKFQVVLGLVSLMSSMQNLVKCYHCDCKKKMPVPMTMWKVFQFLLVFQTVCNFK